MWLEDNRISDWTEQQVFSLQDAGARDWRAIMTWASALHDLATSNVPKDIQNVDHNLSCSHPVGQGIQLCMICQR